MRIFHNFVEAFAEIQRDLGEMGIPVHTQTMQDKDISDDEGYNTIEIQNYIYTVTNPALVNVNPVQPWADAEWLERKTGIEGGPVNPGHAYKLRSDVWDEFLHNGAFAYTYSERFALSMCAENIIQRLISDPLSRQLYIPMFNYHDTKRLGVHRVPCSLGWHFMNRNGYLNMTYFMRSCDFSTHFQNDVYLALKLQDYVAERAEMVVGNFSQFMASLHVYQKDVAKVF